VSLFFDFHYFFLSVKVFHCLLVLYVWTNTSVVSVLFVYAVSVVVFSCFGAPQRQKVRLANLFKLGYASIT